jgi:molybdopterin molybdotransferase
VILQYNKVGEQMELLKVNTLEDAKEKLLSNTIKKGFKTEKIPIINGLGRILAEDIISPIMVPDFRRSSVDGYAVKGEDTWGADESIPVFLELIEDIQIGTKPQKALKTGECSYVPTGGMLPEGADAMVMVEYCEPFDENHIAVYGNGEKGSCVVQIGEDLREGDLLFGKGRKLMPGDIASLASIGISEIEVYRDPTITIISTGDELVAPGQEKSVGQVYEINSYGLYSQAIQKGFKVNSLSIIEDKEELLSEKVKEAMEISDFVVVSGGSSQGKQDITKKVLDKLSSPGVFVHGIAFKPGKPTILGYDEGTETILVGLPGHPVAAMIVFHLVVVWYCHQKMGMEPEIAIPAIFESNLPTAPGRQTCQLVWLIEGERGYIARPILGKSGLISTLSKSQGYVIIDRNKEGIRAGEEVKVYML